MAKGVKTGGRQKGTPNKRTTVQEIAESFDLDPFEVLMMVAAGDWQGLGYDSKTRISFTAAGIEFEEDTIKLSDRVTAAKEASKYLYSQKKAVELSGESNAIKIVIEDYKTKKDDGGA